MALSSLLQVDKSSDSTIPSIQLVDSFINVMCCVVLISLVGRAIKFYRNYIACYVSLRLGHHYFHHIFVILMKRLKY